MTPVEERTDHEAKQRRAVRDIADRYERWARTGSPGLARWPEIATLLNEISSLDGRIEALLTEHFVREERWCWVCGHKRSQHTSNGIPVECECGCLAALHATESAQPPRIIPRLVKQRARSSGVHQPGDDLASLSDTDIDRKARTAQSLRALQQQERPAQPEEER